MNDASYLYGNVDDSDSDDDDFLLITTQQQEEDDGGSVGLFPEEKEVDDGEEESKDGRFVEEPLSPKAPERGPPPADLTFIVDQDTFGKPLPKCDGSCNITTMDLGHLDE